MSFNLYVKAKVYIEKLNILYLASYVFQYFFFLYKRFL